MQATTVSLPAASSRSVWARLYRPASLAMAIGFGAVGLIFLLLPSGVLGFFDALSPQIGLKPAGPAAGFYLALAVAYMYVVTLLAGWMYARPENATLPVLLINAKAASALLSFGLFAFRQPALIYLANGVVDGLIAAGVLLLYLKHETEVRVAN
jgi:hypothetical protein